MLSRVLFVRGFNHCCARVPASCSLALLLRVYAAACAGAGAPCGVQLQSDEGGGEDGKVVGELTREEMVVFLWMCWVMAWSTSASRVAGDGGEKSEPVAVNGIGNKFFFCCRDRTGAFKSIVRPLNCR